MARKYSERIENMDDAAREELDTRIREYEAKHGWQAALAKYKPSPIQLRAIKAGKDATKAKAKKKTKTEVEAAAKKKTKKAVKKEAKKEAKKAPKKKTAKKTAKKAAKAEAAKRKPGRPKGSGNKKKAKKNGVAVKSQGDVIVEGKIDATQFVSMILSHSERLVKAARA